MVKDLDSSINLSYDKKDENILEGSSCQSVKRKSLDRIDRVFTSPEGYKVRSWVKMLKMRDLIIIGFSEKEADEHVI